MFDRYRTYSCFVVLTSVSLLTGCSGSGPQIVPIEGQVTHNGEAVPNVRIYFVPTDGRPSWGVSDGSGHFELHYDPEHPKGAKVGTHTVWISDEGNNIDPTAAASGASQAKRSPELVQVIDKYSQKKSTLKVDVKKADHNFALKLD